MRTLNRSVKIQASEWTITTKLNGPNIMQSIRSKFKESTVASSKHGQGPGVEISRPRIVRGEAPPIGTDGARPALISPNEKRNSSVIMTG
jgi:hypothetical protein